jgi:hypothetical protein
MQIAFRTTKGEKFWCSIDENAIAGDDAADIGAYYITPSVCNAFKKFDIMSATKDVVYEFAEALAVIYVVLRASAQTDVVPAWTDQTAFDNFPADKNVAINVLVNGNIYRETFIAAPNTLRTYITLHPAYAPRDTDVNYDRIPELASAITDAVDENDPTFAILPGEMSLSRAVHGR